MVFAWRSRRKQRKIYKYRNIYKYRILPVHNSLDRLKTFPESDIYFCEMNNIALAMLVPGNVSIHYIILERVVIKCQLFV
jgi:hypothetical protein